MSKFIVPAIGVLALGFVLQLFVSTNQPVDLRTVSAMSAFGDPDPGSRLHGKTVVITGVTSGIGEELTITMLELGATVFGLARSETKLATLASNHGELPGVFNPVLCELSDFDSVASAAENVSRAVSNADLKVDWIINNAGIHYGGPLTLMDVDTSIKHTGIDKCFAVNYLSHVLLIEKLLPLFSVSARVIQVSSSYHWQSSAAMLRVPGNGQMPYAANSNAFDFYQRKLAYSNSKLAQIYHARTMAKQQTQAGKNLVKFISVCPAWVGTNIAPEGLLRGTLAILAFPPSQGIYSIVSAMFRTDVNSGDFVGNTNLLDKLPWVRAAITSGFASSTVPQLRYYFTDFFAMMLMFLQKYDFGAHVQPSSPESYDEEVGDALHSWSLATLKDWL